MTTRRQLLAGAALAALAAPATARAATEDRGLLEVLDRYNEGLVFAYAVAVGSPLLSGRAAESVRGFRAQAIEMDGAISSALTRLGGAPLPRRAAKLAQLPAEIARHADLAAYLNFVITNEQRVVSGWYVSLQKLADPRLVSGAISYMAAGGRRLVVLRDLAGVPLLPRAFETGGD